MKLPTPGPSLIAVAMVLALAAGGVGYAAGSLPKNSVGSAQLKKKAVTAKKIKPGAVGGAKVKDRSLTGADIATNSLGGTQIDESTLEVPVTPGSVLLTGYDFRPRSSTYGYTTDGLGAVVATAGPPPDFTAPLRVPEGATVTAVKLFVVDNGPDSVDVFVGRFVPSTGAYLYSGSVSSSGTDIAVRTLDLAPLPETPGSTQNLTVYLPIGAEYKLYGAQIDYK